MGKIAEMLKDVEPASGHLIHRAAKLAEPARRPRDGVKRLELLERLATELLPIEREAKREVGDKLARVRIETKMPGARKMSLEPLKWRNRAGLPSLALYKVSSGSQMIISNNYSVEPALPTALRNLYTDVINKARSEWVIYTTTFSGVLPADVRKTYLQAKESKAFGDELFIIAEPHWVTTDAPRPVFRGDPLLVGWDGKSLWLLAHFDLTSVEKYAVMEHSSK